MRQRGLRNRRLLFKCPRWSNNGDLEGLMSLYEEDAAFMEEAGG